MRSPYAKSAGEQKHTTYPNKPTNAKYIVIHSHTIKLAV